MWASLVGGERGHYSAHCTIPWPPYTPFQPGDSPFFLCSPVDCLHNFSPFPPLPPSLCLSLSEVLIHDGILFIFVPLTPGTVLGTS